MSLAYVPNGKSAVSVSANEGVVVWDLTLPPKAAGAKTVVNDKDEAWQKLASPSYEERTAAITYYLGHPAAVEEMVADMRRRLGEGEDEAARAAQAQRIEKLGDASYSVRMKAYEDLEQLGAAARNALAAAVEHPSPEVRGRVAGLLNRIGGPADFRAVLAVEVCGLLKTPAAKAELERLAGSKLPCAAHAKAVLARVWK
ncbi:MAG: hypothetical protein NTW87_33925 [Planctomycetota bacterium]|nr:hypothetical protein [Planctomycetota bacterium]